MSEKLKRKFLITLFEGPANDRFTRFRLRFAAHASEEQHFRDLNNLSSKSRNNLQFTSTCTSRSFWLILFNLKCMFLPTE